MLLHLLGNENILLRTVTPVQELLSETRGSPGQTHRSLHTEMPGLSSEIQ